ncbi:hypothetical protein ACWKWU_11550 [Chitinophaga lutea]
MAKQTGVIPFKGKLGKVVGFQLNGEWLLRSLPEHVRQTRRTRRAARQFGKASRLGATMRHALRPHQHIPPQPAAINKLNKALLKILQQDDLHAQKRFIPRFFDALKGFAFTPHCPLISLLHDTPTVSRDTSGDILVHIPAMKEPGGNLHATHLLVQAIALSTDGASAQTSASEPMLLEAFQPCEAFTLTIPRPAAGVTCVVLEAVPIQLLGDQLYVLKNRNFIASEIIAVLQPERDFRMSEPPTPRKDGRPRFQFRMKQPKRSHGPPS